MPMKIVEKYRPVYRDNFMQGTLYAASEEVVTDAFHTKKNCGFKNHHIIVKFNGTEHPDIIASTVSLINEQNMIEPHINVRPSFKEKESRVFQKMVLAHEWIHAMMSIRDRDKIDFDIERMSMYILAGWLRQRSIWIDLPELTVKMHAGLRRLLVSEETIKEVLKDFNLDPQGLAAILHKSPHRARPLIDGFTKAFAGKWSVDLWLVYDRLKESLDKAYEAA